MWSLNRTYLDALYDQNHLFKEHVEEITRVKELLIKIILIIYCNMIVSSIKQFILIY